MAAGKIAAWSPTMIMKQEAVHIQETKQDADDECLRRWRQGRLRPR